MTLLERSDHSAHPGDAAVPRPPRAVANVSADTARSDTARSDTARSDTVLPDPARPDPVGRDVGTQWAIAAAHGDPVAQAAFVRHTQAELWRLVAALVEPSAADDLAQETYLRAFRALPSFEGRATARTWLFGIARRVCADHLRAVTRRRRLDGLLSRQRAATQQPDPAGAVGAADLVRALTPDRRSALVLTQVIGLSYEETAAVEGVPIGTIRSRVARARADLIKALGDAP